MSLACPPTLMIYPSTSSRLPWSPSPKRNAHERRSIRPRGASFDYQIQSLRAPSVQSYVKSRNTFKDNHHSQHGPHTSLLSSSLLERIELSCEERSLLDRMDLDEEELSIHNDSSDSLQSWNTRICGSQQHTNAFPDPNGPRSVCCWP